MTRKSSWLNGLFDKLGSTASSNINDTRRKRIKPQSNSLENQSNYKYQNLFPQRTPTDLLNSHIDVQLHRGSLFGYVDYYLDQKRRFYAMANSSKVVVAYFERKKLQEMEENNPDLLLLVQRMVIKQFALELGNIKTI